jgi:hypothetical protein
VPKVGVVVNPVANETATGVSVKLNAVDAAGETVTLFWKTEYPTAVHVGGQLAPASVVTSTL